MILSFDLRKLLGVIEVLKDLESNWDSYDADPIKEESYIAGIKLLKHLATKNLPQPLLVPVPNGNLQIEFTDHGLDIEIEVVDESTYKILYNDKEFTSTIRDNDFIQMISYLDYKHTNYLNDSIRQ